jgi:serine/threonine protein phosphatase PrpC/predicted Ser/Thr protein kinase
MSDALEVSIGQHSDRGRKAVNQDFYGACVPQAPALASKGIAVAIADGIGSSDVSQIAAEFAVIGFLDDYYCTSDAWSVRKSIERVLTATNSWLHSRTRCSPYRYEEDRGYVCTLSGLVIKSNTAHVFHVGDTRIYRALENRLEQLTEDHRVRVADGDSYLARAVGFKAQVEIDYQAFEIERGDVFLLATDGVYEHVDDAFVAAAIRRHRTDLDAAARAIVEEAYRRGSADNLTAQIVVVDNLPLRDAAETRRHSTDLPLPPLLQARDSIDGYTVQRVLHASHRSHVYLAVDAESRARVLIKAPSVDLTTDPAHLERFMLEEWIARRISSAHVLKPHPHTRARRSLYVVMEYIEGQTLAQWMIDHPQPELEAVRCIVEQIARGLQAFHRLEMLHQDLRPENVMIDGNGTVKIIDFGSASVAGIDELAGVREHSSVPGAVQYAAPEYFLGERGSERSDLYSLAAIAYQMLSGRVPYAGEAARARTVSAQRKLRYRSVLHAGSAIPRWIDDVLAKALDPDPARRHEALSEFVHDLRHPSPFFLARARPALVERHPVLFWQWLSALLAAMLFLALFVRYAMP